MEKLLKIPVAFFLIASCLGLFLRYQLFAPTENVVYTYILHAHSHVMFLGWILNVMIIAFTLELVQVKKFTSLFWFLQVCVVGMLLSFPVQGYGAVSIIFSALHTVGVFVFIIRFFRAAKGKASLPVTTGKISLFFFVLSSIGPFVLGYLKAKHPELTALYRFAIYFYLHFQYNGAFTFGVAALLLKEIDNNLNASVQKRSRVAIYTLALACLPAYLLSVLWAQPSIVFNIVAALAAFVQILAFFMMVPAVRKGLLIATLPPAAKWMFCISLLALIIKYLLQLISAHPSPAMLTDQYRYVVIAYLHLVLIGFISFAMMGWLIMRAHIRVEKMWHIALIIIGFATSEVLLALSPWFWGPWSQQLIFASSAVLVLGFGMVFFSNRAHPRQS